jgi:hypothetical protein
MTDSTKATRATIQLGERAIDGYMLPDGSYRMSLSQAAECVGLTARNAFDFLRSNTFKALMGDGYTLSVSELEPDEDQGRGQSRFRALPLEVVSIYWSYQSHRGNKAAFALVTALVTETLERRFDDAFGVTRSEAERNDRLMQEKQRLQQDLERLGEGFAMDDVIRAERDSFEHLLRDNGIDPWGLPSNKNEE